MAGWACTPSKPLTCQVIGSDQVTAGMAVGSRRKSMDQLAPHLAMSTHCGLPWGLRLAWIRTVGRSCWVGSGQTTLLGLIITKIIPRWTINADVEWQGWKTVGSLPRDFVGSTALDSVSRRLWKNSWVYRLGAEYAATDQLALRGGYFYDETPIPDNTFDANVPNANLHGLTAGSGYKWGRATFDLAYLIGFYEKRSIDNSTLDPNNKGGARGLGPPAFGSYSTTSHVLTVSVTFKF